MSELATTNQRSHVAIQNNQVGDMMRALIDGGITEQNVAALERLAALYERSQAKAAEQEFAKAFTELQRDIPKIRATREVPNKDGSVRYMFAPYEEIMRQAQPFLSQHGFSVSFNTRWEAARIIVSCKMLHSGGHSQTNEFAARVGSGPPGANEAQADMAVKTLAKRGALCDALNIVVEHDTDADDARIEGHLISPEQVAELKRLVVASKADEKKFFAYAGASKYEEIRSARYPDIIDNLERRARKNQVQHTHEEQKNEKGEFTF